MGWGAYRSGLLWPEATGYVEGYARLQSDGAGSVILDNSANHADVFAKLMRNEGSVRRGIRAVFIHAGGRFTLEKIRAGTYEVHYLDLDTGIVRRSDPFMVQGPSAAAGRSHVAVALHTGGNSAHTPDAGSGIDF